MGLLIADNMLVIREPKTFDFNFDLPKAVDNNLKDKTEFIICWHESLAEYKIKNDINQLFLKYKYGNDIHEHGKQ